MLDEDGVGDCIKCCGKVQEDESHRVSSVQSHANVIHGGDEGSFLTVFGSETRLSGVE